MQVARPHTIYQGTRFDASGLVLQVTLDGEHSFCTDESATGGGGGSGGRGLCNEFGMNRPIGYDEVSTGGKFPKLGVGVLMRVDDGKYEFMRDHPVEPFTVEYCADESAATFDVLPIDCRGYAVHLRKRLTVRDNELSIEYQLRNVGERRIQTAEYNHNFVLPAGRIVGPDYQLRLPCNLKPSNADPGPQSHNRIITWPKTPPGTFHSRGVEFADDYDPAWTLIHQPSGLWMRERTDRPWDSFALWGAARIICPEAFVAVDVEPAATLTWRRSYTFGNHEDHHGHD